jgi:hypothetical protein
MIWAMDYLDALKKHYRTHRAAAQAIGLTPQSMVNFGRRGKVPIEWQIRWELDSKGAVKAVDLPDALRCSPGAHACVIGTGPNS